MPAPSLNRRAFLGLSGAALAAALPWPNSSAPRQSAAIDLTGQVIWPQDPGYDEARLTFNARFSRFPAAIVMCERVEEVQHAVRWARQQGIPLRARSGGHSYEGFSSLDNGLVIDVSGLNGVTVDAARGEAVIGGGVRLSDLYHRLWAAGVTTPAGTCPGVGIAGLTLGGGVGFLGRQFGLTCDQLLAVELVDANGEAIQASATEHADLFWALQGGGGGNFGIATSFTLRVYPIGNVALYTLSWPWDDLAEVLDVWQRWAPFTDERLTGGLGAPRPGEGAISSSGQFNGPESELPALIAPLQQAGHPSPPQIRTVPFITAAEQFAGTPAAHSRFKNSSALVYEPLSSEAIDTFIAQMQAAPTGSNLVGFFPFGGAVAAIDTTATAFPHRQALFDLQYQAYWPADGDAEAGIAWVRAMREAMLPYTHGAYVNYIDADIPDWATAYYGANLGRLSAIKAAYDPENVFNGPQSVPLPDARSGTALPSM